jgi:hypothetical protein
LRGRGAAGTIEAVDEPVVHRDEMERVLFAIHDINVNVLAIRELLEGGDEGEEEEADA